MGYFDSHCHLTDARFEGEADAAAERARAAGVDRFVLIASDEEDALSARDLAAALGVWSTAGIHPHAATRTATGFPRVREFVAEPGVVAVGETGLDYYYDNSPRRTQRESFERHLELAADTGKPVVVHSRDADDDTIALVRSAGESVRGVLHCFAGGPSLFEAGVEAGWYVSFSGLITFRSYGTKDLVAETPADRLLIETDAPYLAPVPHRGKRNEPAYVVEVARAVAELRGETLEAVAERTTRNALTFYQLEG
ncbi:MAG: TatD family hydrolase [Gemmatimonadota bacterium]